MPSGTVPTVPAVNPPQAHKYKFQQERLPIKKWDSAIKEGNELFRDTSTQIDKICDMANRDSGYIFSALAGDLITQTNEMRENLTRLEKRRRSFGIMKYIRFDNEGMVALRQCTRTLESVRNASDTMLRVLEATENSVGPQSRSNQSPDRAGDTDDRDCVSTKSTFSTFNAPDYSSSFSQRPIIIQHVKEVTLHLHDGPTTVRGITLAGGADGFTLNCHTTESRGSMHNNMQFPPASTSEARAPESATPGSGV